MPNVRVDEEVYEALKAFAEPFVDTPNSVLRRLLKLDGAGAAEVGVGAQTDEGARPVRPQGGRGKTRRRATRRKRGPRAPVGTLLPEEEYVEPIVASLVERGGSAPARDVVAAVGVKLEGKLTEADRERLASGGIRWESRVQFVRLRLVEQGVLAKDSPRGIWQLAQVGVESANGARSEGGAA